MSTSGATSRATGSREPADTWPLSAGSPLYADGDDTAAVLAGEPLDVIAARMFKENR